MEVRRNEFTLTRSREDFYDVLIQHCDYFFNLSLKTFSSLLIFGVMTNEQ